MTDTVAEMIAHEKETEVMSYVVQNEVKMGVFPSGETFHVVFCF